MTQEMKGVVKASILYGPNRWHLILDARVLSVPFDFKLCTGGAVLCSVRLLVTGVENYISSNACVFGSEESDAWYIKGHFLPIEKLEQVQQLGFDSASEEEKIYFYGIYYTGTRKGKMLFSK